jgi:hypothetical protein
MAPGVFGLERDLLRPYRAWTHWASPLGRAVVGALYAGLLSITWAYVEKVRTQFFSLRQPALGGVFSGRCRWQLGPVAAAVSDLMSGLSTGRTAPLFSEVAVSL